MRILKLASFFIIWICVNHGVMADYLDPTGKTNVNVQTNLFKESVGNVQEFEGQIDEGRNAAIGKLNSPNEGVGFISGKSQEEVESNASSLSAINANDLQDKGTQKMLEENIIEEIYIDETKPLNIEHQKDAKKIADASDLLLAKLMDLLKALDVDCKTVKGNKEIEPEYHLEIKKEKTKDTVYNKTLCEELRNKYNCTDTLSMSCKTKVMQWEDWQDRTIDFGGADIYWNLVGWMYSYKWDDREFGLHIKQEPHVMADIGREIAKRIGATTDQVAYVASIKPTYKVKLGGVFFEAKTPGQGFGQIFHLEKKSYTWEIFKFSYKYREGKLVCGEWNEEWNEECRLQ